jgi:acyl carrier protein
MDGDHMIEQVIEVIESIGNVSGIQVDQDIYDAGVTSVMALPLLLELEDKFGATISDDQFIAARTPRQITSLLSSCEGY